MFVLHFFAGLSFAVVVLDVFLFGSQKKWPLVALEGQLSYKITIVQEFAWVGSA